MVKHGRNKKRRAGRIGRTKLKVTLFSKNIIYFVERVFFFDIVRDVAVVVFEDDANPKFWSIRFNFFVL